MSDLSVLLAEVEATANGGNVALPDANSGVHLPTGYRR